MSELLLLRKTQSKPYRTIQVIDETAFDRRRRPLLHKRLQVDQKPCPSKKANRQSLDESSSSRLSARSVSLRSPAQETETPTHLLSPNYQTSCPFDDSECHKNRV